MKLRNLIFVLILFLGANVFAQVPREMSYQIMLLDPDNGKVLANEETEIRIELRKGSSTGTAVWSNTYKVTSDKTGLCNITLSFDEDLDWGNSSYFFATIINGKECGAPKITSVPYALYAASLDDMISERDLIGTWIGETSQKSIVSFTFNSDGSGTIVYLSQTTTINWKLKANGTLICFNQTDSLRNQLYEVYLIEKDKLLLGKFDGYAVALTKQ